MIDNKCHIIHTEFSNMPIQRFLSVTAKAKSPAERWNIESLIKKISLRQHPWS